jgi:DNA-binding MarR family transcriptional regulator
VQPTRTPTEDELALAESLWDVFGLFKTVAQRAAQAVELGSPERARLLYGLKAGACRAGHLAHQAKISPSTITEVVEGLAHDGLVRREGDPDDRRAVRVALTAEGRRHLQRFERAAAIVLAESLQGLTPAQRQHIKIAFADLREALSSAEPQEAAPAR